MAGHSKWHNIQHRKGAQDAKRAKIFTKLIRELVVAAKKAGPDPANNPTLRSAIDKALQSNMTRKVIDSAVARGAGGLEGDDMNEMRYEGYGPGGVAIMVDCLSDNKNRTVAEVRHAFNKYGGNMGTDGCVAYMFEHKGLILLEAGLDEERVMDVALEAGADDVVETGEGQFEIQTSPDQFESVKTACQEAELTIAHFELTWQAENDITLDTDGAQKMLKLVDALEDLDDVQNVYSNADIPDAILESLE